MTQYVAARRREEGFSFAIGSDFRADGFGGKIARSAVQPARQGRMGEPR